VTNFTICIHVPASATVVDIPTVV